MQNMQLDVSRVSDDVAAVHRAKYLSVYAFGNMDLDSTTDMTSIVSNGISIAGNDMILA